MNIEQWWPNLKPATQAWLIENNGDAVPDELAAEITEAGGPAASDAWRAGDDDEPSGFYFPDEVVDWIEAVGNGEAPGAPRPG